MQLQRSAPDKINNLVNTEFKISRFSLRRVDPGELPHHSHHLGTNLTILRFICHRADHPYDKLVQEI